MLKNIKDKLLLGLVMAFFMLSSFMAPHEAQSKTPDYSPAATPIKVVGKTDDNKYKIYDLQGSLNDEHWTSESKLWTSADLLDRMDMISIKDVNTGVYKCGFICKDDKGQVVGLSPKYAFLKKKK